MSASRIDEIVKAIEALPANERVVVLERVNLEFGTPKPPAVGEAAGLVGLFSDMTDVVDAVCESAMTAREADALRHRDA